VSFRKTCRRYISDIQRRDMHFNIASKDALELCVRNFIGRTSNGVFITLHYNYYIQKSYINNNFGKLIYDTPSNYTKIFLDHVNNAIYKNAFKRYKKRIPIFCFYEHSVDSRIHLHAVADLPDRIHIDDFKRLAEDFAKEKTFVYNKVDVTRIYSDDLSAYITKYRSKLNVLDSYDVFNSNVHESL
jgi:predicted DNA-binding protein (UPF0278 family)